MRLGTAGGRRTLREVSFEDVAGRFGTPYYLYDLQTVGERIAAVRAAFGDAVEILYAIKANPNRRLLERMRESVDGVDVSSGGELAIALAAGYPPGCVSFAGPGKTRGELHAALTAGIGYLSIESFRELGEVEALVRAGAPRASIMLRVNPKLLTKEFAVKMGGKASPFGIDEEDLSRALAFVTGRPEIFEFRGLHVYAGTQCLSEEHLAQNVANTLAIAARAYAEYGAACSAINIGGGFGVPYYEGQRELDLVRLAALCRGEFERYRTDTGDRPRILLELGRYLVAEAGLYVARIVSEKLSRGERFLVLDGGMNHHLAASGNMGAAVRKNYRVVNLSRADAAPERCTLVGPLCTPLDVMGKDVLVGQPVVGDLIGFLYSGSYGYSASPLRFLGHEEPAEVIVGDQ